MKPTMLIIFIIFFSTIQFADIATYEKECKNDNIDSCFEAGKYFYEKRQKKELLGKAIMYLKKSCDANHGESCYYLGFMWHEVGNINNAILHFEKSCSLKNKNGCHNAAVLWGTRKDNKPNNVKAQYFYKQACKLDKFDACLYMGKIHLKKSMDYLIKSCVAGHETSCTFMQLINMKQHADMLNNMKNMSDIKCTKLIKCKKQKSLGICIDKNVPDYYQVIYKKAIFNEDKLKKCIKCWQKKITCTNINNAHEICSECSKIVTY